MSEEPHPYDRNEEQLQTPEQARKTEFWAKVQLMGHTTLYGYVQEPIHSSGIGMHVLPSGDEEEKEPYYREFGANAIFGITPIGEEECRALAGRRSYHPEPLNTAEQADLVRESTALDEALTIVQAGGYTTMKDEDAGRAAALLAFLYLLVKDLADELDREDIEVGIYNSKDGTEESPWSFVLDRVAHTIEDDGQKAFGRAINREMRRISREVDGDFTTETVRQMIGAGPKYRITGQDEDDDSDTLPF